MSLLKIKCPLPGQLLIFCGALLLGQEMGMQQCRASAIEAENIVFILDASGSMAGQMEGRSKMEIAKEVLSSLIQDLPEGVNVGLVAYGHRKKSDCSDVEELAALGPLNKPELVKKIAGIHSVGMTPIAGSIRQVADRLKSAKKEATIILVSDGQETCGGDPCALVKELKSAGISFVMHVIGFDVSDKEKAQLACIADAGGGNYFAARNAGELVVAAKKVVEKTQQSSGTLKVTAMRNGKPLDAYARVLKPAGEEGGEGEQVAASWTKEEGCALKLMPGVYDLVVENQQDAGKPTVKIAGVTIEAGKSVEKVAEFSGGTLKVKAMRNGKPLDAYARVLKPAGEEGGKGEQVAASWTKEEGCALNLLPGVYDVVVEDSASKEKKTMNGVKLDAAETKTLDVQF